ncbi:MAG: putative Ig domain-containing protein, partial [Nannocystaceae bacterium]
TFPVAAVDANFVHNLDISGGSGDYQISVTGLPDGLTVSTNGQIAGKPTESGDFQISVEVTDVVTLESVSEDCALLAIEDALAFDPLSAPKGCIEITGGALDLRDSLSGGTGAPISCAQPEGGDPNGTCPNRNGNGVTPSGIEWDPDNCTASGTVTESAVGTWVWMIQVQQSGAEIYVPLCASKELEPGAPHDLFVLADGGDNYLIPGQFEYDPTQPLEFGPGDNGPEFEVYGADCSGGQCNGFGYSYTATCSPFCGGGEILPDGGACAQTFNTNPSGVIDEGAGIIGFFHNLFATTEVSLEAWSDLTQPRLNWTKRPWVASFEFSYCTAPNADDCTSGGDVTDVQSQLHYAVVAWPDTSAP